MATIQAFGPLRFKTISPDEIAIALRAAILYALSPEATNTDGFGIRKLVRDALPVLRDVQLSVVLSAFSGKMLTADWEALRETIRQISSN